MVSVVICTYNRAQSLRRALSSLAAMDVPADLPWEVIVVDNRSRDATREVAQTFARTSPLQMRYVFEGEQGLNRARNRGVKEATGDILSFLDDDVVVTTNWLVEVKKAFDAYQVACVGGRVLLHETLPRPPWWHASYDGALGKFDGGDAIIFAGKERFRMIGIGANLSFRSSVFGTHGSFRPDLDRRRGKLLMGGDTEFYDRLRRGGEASMYYPGAVVYQCPDAERFTRQYLRRWHFRVGEWRSTRGTEPAGKQVPTIFGIPRWRYRRAWQFGFQAVACTLAGCHGEAFYNEIQCITDLGGVFGMMKALLRQPTVE